MQAILEVRLLDSKVQERHLAESQRTHSSRQVEAFDLLSQTESICRLIQGNDLMPSDGEALSYFISMYIKVYDQYSRLFIFVTYFYHVSCQTIAVPT